MISLLLRERGVVRVVGQPAGDRVGRSDWMIRLRVPYTARAVAAALARRPDTAWVSLATMGAEVRLPRSRSDATWG